MESITPKYSKVQVWLECSASCNEVAKSLNQAVVYLTNAIHFNQTIKVAVKYSNFGPDSNTIGNCTPNLLMDTNDGFIQKPSALLRQTNSIHVDIDMVINLNANQKGQHLEEVICHELLHGLGFVSAVGTSLFGSPLTYVFNEGLTYIMDRYILHHGLKLSSSLKDSGLNQLMKDATIEGTLVFTTGRKIIPLETSLSPFQLGSSVSHLSHAKYDNSRDLLMTHRISGNNNLAAYIKANGKWLTSPYGPDTLAILQTIGYTLNPNPSLVNAYSATPSIQPSCLIFSLFYLLSYFYFFMM
ncbi:hypothetical protein DSO57_1034973 [Entomophthora muscae]|uniref:Uncharacterized protein n=1 Tax=Entomophthora muscae TaxID=34485 RepID=A0ACC2TAQ6_9FUNG|nr:hypothetical protein DSO57_1034973 [Entomophthora muscae]